MKFRLRAWSEQKLYDCNDYLVEASTLEEAVEKLRNAQDFADSEGRTVQNDDGIAQAEGLGRIPGVRPLEPEEVVDGDEGIVEVNEQGKPIRSISPIARLFEDSKLYTVTWAIDVDAASPEEAAAKVLSIQRDPESTATVFEVRLHGSPQGTEIRVDLGGDADA